MYVLNANENHTLCTDNASNHLADQLCSGRLVISRLFWTSDESSTMFLMDMHKCRQYFTSLFATMIMATIYLVTHFARINRATIDWIQYTSRCIDGWMLCAALLCKSIAFASNSRSIKHDCDLEENCSMHDLVLLQLCHAIFHEIDWIFTIHPDSNEWHFLCIQYRCNDLFIFFHWFSNQFLIYVCQWFDQVKKKAHT